MQNRTLIIGSRSSRLALTQTEFVRDMLKQKDPFLDIKIKKIKTTGDKILDAPLSKIGDKGLFTKEIEEALFNREIDLAVHSMKDLPTALPDGLKLGAILKREDARDVLVSKTGLALSQLPIGAKVGTSSLRRRAQILRMRDDLEVMDLRGNLDTRVKKLEDGLYDAIVLAYAGIKRLGLKLNISPIETNDILPQAGQGALGLEIREDNRVVENIAKPLDDSDTHTVIVAERSLLADLGGGCQVPIGVYASIEQSRLFIRAGVFSLDGTRAASDQSSGDKKDAQILGKNLAKKLLSKGARQILDEVYNV